MRSRLPGIQSFAKLVFLTIAVMALFATSCVVPRTKKQPNADGVKVKADHRFLLDGRTTRDEVNQNLGDVEINIHEAQIFVGQWKTTKAIWFIVGGSPYGGGGVAGGELWKTRRILIEY